MRALERELISQDVHQQASFVDLHAVGFSIDGEFKLLHAGDFTQISKAFVSPSNARMLARHPH